MNEEKKREDVSTFFFAERILLLSFSFIIHKLHSPRESHFLGGIFFLSFLSFLLSLVNRMKVFSLCVSAWGQKLLEIRKRLLICIHLSFLLSSKKKSSQKIKQRRKKSIFLLLVERRRKKKLITYFKKEKTLLLPTFEKIVSSNILFLLLSLSLSGVFFFFQKSLQEEYWKEWFFIS